MDTKDSNLTEEQKAALANIPVKGKVISHESRMNRHGRRAVAAILRRRPNYKNKKRK